MLAREFYVDYLGCSWDWESREPATAPLYAQVSRDALRLHLSAHYGDGTPGTHLFVPIDDIEALQAELLAHEAPFSRPGVETVPWGRTLTVIDPFANHLVFCEWTGRPAESR